MKDLVEISKPKKETNKTGMIYVHLKLMTSI